MKSRLIVILISLINIAFGLIFLADGFLNRKTGFRIIKERRIEKSSSSKASGSGHVSEILVDNYNTRYNVPQSVYYELSVGDSISLYNSAVFNRPNKIGYTVKEDFKIINVGILNSSLLGVLLCAVSLIIYTILLFRPKVFGRQEFHQLIALLSTWLLVIVGAFYYFFQP